MRLAGDTVASALLANGMHFVGRSFKYHRPRGIFGHGTEEPNALVRSTAAAAASMPNLRATAVELFDGLSAASRRTAGRRSISTSARSTTLLSPLLRRPASTTRRSCGRGRFWNRSTSRHPRRSGPWPRPDGPDPDRYQHIHAHCDVLVVGAGRPASPRRWPRPRPASASSLRRAGRVGRRPAA